MPPTNWQVISESSFPWERDALEFVRERFPEHEPHRAWQVFEFIAEDGSINEVDLLVLTPAGFFLVEIKSHPGSLRGDAGTWVWEHEGKAKTLDNPVVAANRKAKKLKSLLEKQKAIKNFKGKIPFLEPLVFCSAPDLRLELQNQARYRVCLRDREATKDVPARPGILAALLRRECGGLESTPKTLINSPMAKAISQAMEQAGIRPSQRNRQVQDYRLETSLHDGPGFQDWLASHVSMETVKRRIRLYLVHQGATVEDRFTIERAAKREFQLLETLHHPGILRAFGYTEHQTGPALIFEHDPKSIRFDHYLTEYGQRLPPQFRLDLLREIAEVVSYAHDKKVVHRALAPQSILVTDPDAPRPHLKVFNWQVGYRDDSTSGGSSRAQISGTIHPDRLVEDASTVYMAPETSLDPENTGEYTDIFSLGAIAYHLFAGQAPAANPVELGEKLRQSRGLQISSVLNGAGKDLQFLIQYSTHPEVSSRIDSARDFLDLLDAVERELLPAEPDVVEDPTEAKSEDKLPGGYVVKKRLGSGSTSVALLVEKNNEEYVLKVAADPEHNNRLRDEGEVLRKLRHQHIVEHLETLKMGERVCLVMRRAGEETLGDRLRKEGRLHMDLLQRFGEDLIGVVLFLEEQGIPHRDIKPDNIGVGKVGRGDKLHLVLFDFSLSRTPRENIGAGTVGYLEPFLSLRVPKRWDLHAERYSAAVTLYELATGTLPKWGDGKSDPAQLDCEATIEAELFDASLREQLASFFRRALKRTPAERFDNSEEMRSAWRHCFEGVAQPVSTDHADWAEVEKRLQQANLETRIADLGLSTRATNALDRINVLSVKDLLAHPAAGLPRLRGVGNQTRREIANAVKTLRLHLHVPERTTRPGRATQTQTGGPEPLVTSVDMLAARILRTAPGSRSHTEHDFLRAFLGLDPDFPEPWPTQTDVAMHLGVTRARIGQLANASFERWRRDPSMTKLRTDITDLLTTGGGVMTVDELTGAVLLSRGSVEDEPTRSQLARAVARVAVEAERLMAEPRFMVRRDHNRTLVATSPHLADYAVRLGREADCLAAEDPLAAPARALDRLRAVRLPSGVELLSDARLLRLAANSSQSACVSSRKEIYPRGMSSLRAVKLSQGALVGIPRLSVSQIRDRVSGRYPEAAPLPDRPDLDILINAAGLDLEWDPGAPDGGRYRSRAMEGHYTSDPTSSLHRRSTTTVTTLTQVPPEIAQARQFEERLQRALADRSFVAMTVEPRWYFDARNEICSRFPIDAVDFEALFLAALRKEADKGKVKWQKVLEADSQPGSDDWRRLLVLVRRAIPHVETAILESRKPVLLVYPGLLTRYDLMDLLERLRDKVGRSDGIPGLWMLIASDESTELPVLDGQPIPVIGRAEWARIPETWLRNEHRGGAGGTSVS